MLSKKAVSSQMVPPGAKRDGQPSNHTFRVLSKHGVSPCSATLYECQMKLLTKS